MPARGDGYTFEHNADVIDRAYTEGLSDAWNPVQARWKDPSEVTREAIRIFLAPQTTIWRYTHGVPDSVRVSPDGYGLENYYLARSGADEIQLDLFLDYASNVALYPSSTSAPTGRRCSRCGAGTIRSSCRPELKPLSATSLVPTSGSSTPVTSPCRPTSKRSPPRSASSSPDPRHRSTRGRR